MKFLKYLVILILMISSFSCREEESEGSTGKRVIVLENTPDKRPYSPGFESDNTLYVSGQVAIESSTGKIVEGGIESETRQTLENLRNVVEKAGYTMDNVVSCTVLLADISFYTTVNEIYMEFFPEDPPARMAFAVKDLPFGALIEIAAIAKK